MKKSLSLFLAIIILLFAVPSANAQSAADYILKNVQSPTVSSIGGEWGVIAAVRGEALNAAVFKEKYTENAKKVLTENSGVLSSRKYTEYSRAVLGLTAAGEDAQSFCGFDLTAPLLDREKVSFQGTNGVIWAIIALSCRDFAKNTAEIENAKGDYIKTLLSLQNSDGGWSLSKNMQSQPDITAMALCALSLNNAGGENCEKALSCLSAMQKESGGFESYGEENAESAAQAAVALLSLGISFDDPRFVKNGNVLSALNKYALSGGAYKHNLSGSENLMATEQAALALAALRRAENKKTALYDMRDIKIKAAPVFSDIENSPARSAIEALYERKIISGKGNGIFDPDGLVTRAEIAAMLVRAASLSGGGSIPFSDVSGEDWFFGAVSAAYENGIVTGVSQTLFAPFDNVTRAQLAALASRLASVKGENTDLSEEGIYAAISKYADFESTPQYARAPLAFLCEKGIFPLSNGGLSPGGSATRAEVALVIYGLLNNK